MFQNKIDKNTRSMMRKIIFDQAANWERDSEGNMIYVLIYMDDKYSEITDWCRNNCSGTFICLDPDIFDIEYNGGKTFEEMEEEADKLPPGNLFLPIKHKIIWLFEKADDATNFKLTWG